MEGEREKTWRPINRAQSPDAAALHPSVGSPPSAAPNVTRALGLISGLTEPPPADSTSDQRPGRLLPARKQKSIRETPEPTDRYLADGEQI